jgi:hypothetical protein
MGDVPLFLFFFFLPPRNFPYQWKVGGSSDWPCSEVYAGPTAASEAETQALVSYLLANKGGIVSYITLHAYGRAVLTPWGYTHDLPVNYSELVQLASVFREAVSKSAKEDGRESMYSVGSAGDEIYNIYLARLITGVS